MSTALNMSWKRISSSHFSSNRALKRVNSKEDFRPASEDEEGARTFSFEEIDTILKRNSKGIRTKAMTALKSAHCSETLQCLFALFHLEDNHHDTDEEVPESIIKKFVQHGAESEIFLPEQLRNKLIDSPDSDEALEELKIFVLSDLRFNPVLRRVLATAEEK